MQNFLLFPMVPSQCVVLSLEGGYVFSPSPCTHPKVEESGAGVTGL